MHLRHSRLSILWLFLFLPFAAVAQVVPDSTRQDSIGTYNLGSVVVTASAVDVTTSTVQELSFAEISATDATTVQGIVHRMPAARIQTNSRGESLLYLRGVGERQVALFFDGALLNTPWDNRVDLSLVPLAAVGGITLSKGVPSVLYGANVLGGAVNIVSQELRNPGSLTEAELLQGSGSLLSGSVTHLGSSGPVNWIGSGSWTRREGLVLPSSTALLNDATRPFRFHQNDEDLRTNTDARIASLFARGELRLVDDGLRLGLSVNGIDAEKGVAPEGNVEDARFWRYPLWRSLTVALNGDYRSDEERNWELKGALWWSGFAQEIEQFTSAEYRTLSDRQEDQDRTLGGRFVVERNLSGIRLAGAINALTSSHEQVEIAYDSLGLATATPPLLYEQRIVSFGLESETRLGEALSGTVGIGYDLMTTPKTGDKPAQEGFSGVTYAAGLGYRASPLLALRLSAGQKLRFPTMRELYGEALRRFLLNPDLKPERATMAEVAAELETAVIDGSLVGFASVVVDAIDQRNVDTLGGRRRQRINLPGSSTIGVELIARARPIARLDLDAHLTLQRIRGRATSSTGADSSFPLVERPSMIGMVAASYRLPMNFGLMAEVVVNGGAEGLTEENELVPLGTSAVVNGRLSWRFFAPVTRNFSSEIFLRVNNITDEITYQQLGLPGVGREIVGGVKVTL